MALTRQQDAPSPAAAWPGRRLQQWLDRGRFDWPGLVDLWSDDEMEAFKIEEFQEGDELVVRAELPGIDPDKDVEITMSDHVLRVRAERRREERQEDAKGFRSEFSYGAFTRTVSLPAGATEADVKASYRDGILEVRVPLDRQTAEARKIPIARA